MATPAGVDNTSAIEASTPTSSVFQYSYEDGRRYSEYKHSRYPIPTDDIEHNREDMKHALMLEITDGKLFFAPIGDEPKKIIDLGTGTGKWAIEAAEKFPDAQVTGVDFTPVQPARSPPNLTFKLYDIENERMNGSDYDLVHLRQMMPVLKDPGKMLKQAFDNTKPGGYIEIQEFGGMPYCDDGTMAPEYGILRFTDICQSALAKFGSDFRIGNHLQEPLEKAGFTNVTVQKLKVPIGPWAKDKTLALVGSYFRTIMGELITAMAGRPFSALEMEKEAIDAVVQAAKRDLENPEIHAYFEYLFWTAQKPGA